MERSSVLFVSCRFFKDTLEKKLKHIFSLLMTTESETHFPSSFAAFCLVNRNEWDIGLQQSQHMQSFD